MTRCCVWTQRTSCSKSVELEVSRIRMLPCRLSSSLADTLRYETMGCTTYHDKLIDVLDQPGAALFLHSCADSRLFVGGGGFRDPKSYSMSEDKSEFGKVMVVVTVQRDRL